MTKLNFLQLMESAEKVHLEQMQKIIAAISGETVENPTALGKMECECGVWFYSNEQMMKKILSPQLFERLDKAHEKWHQEYVYIHELFFKEEKKKGFLSKIIKRKVSKELLDKAKYYYKELQLATEDLLSASLSAKRRVQALPDAKFEELEAL
jgi:hypothetical protein